MGGDALKEAIKALLAHGENAQDSKLKKMAAAKHAPPAAAPEACPECGKPMMDGKCAACGYEAPVADGDGDEAGLASLLEQGAQEG